MCAVQGRLLVVARGRRWTSIVCVEEAGGREQLAATWWGGGQQWTGHRMGGSLVYVCTLHPSHCHSATDLLTAAPLLPAPPLPPGCAHVGPPVSHRPPQEAAGPQHIPHGKTRRQHRNTRIQGQRWHCWCWCCWCCSWCCWWGCCWWCCQAGPAAAQQQLPPTRATAAAAATTTLLSSNNASPSSSSSSSSSRTP